MRTRSILVVAMATTLAAAGVLLVRVCADGGAMAAAYQTCRCRGFEWELYDRTPADGPRRTVCFGFIDSRTCHQFRDGPIVPCRE